MKRKREVADGPPNKQRGIDKYYLGTNKPRTIVSQEAVDKLVVDYVISEMRPMRTVNKPSFVKLVTGLRPGAEVMCRQTLSGRIKDEYRKMEHELKRDMSEVKYVCTTADIWSSTHRSFLGMTGHWVNNNTLERKSAALGCRRFTGTHSHDKIARAIADVHTTFNIEGKVVKTCTDNGANMVKAFTASAEAQVEAKNQPPIDEYVYVSQQSPDTDHADDEEDSDSDENNDEHSFDSLADLIEQQPMGEQDDSDTIILPEHQRCCSHTLNLVATTDAAKALDMDNSRAYKKMYREVMGKCDALWNLTNRSTKAADAAFQILGYRFSRPCATRWNSHYDAITLVLKAGDKLNTVCKQLGVPLYLPQHVSFLREYAALMGPVAQAVDVLQGEKNCYLGYVIPTISRLMEKLNAANAGITQPLQAALLSGLKKRFTELLSNPELIMATITHPKFKMSYIPAESHATYLLRLEQEINSQMGSVAPVSVSLDDDDFFANPNIQNGTVQHHLAYLNDPATEVAMLQKHLQVKELFIKYNTVIPSSAPVERLFSTASLILTKHRNRLSDSMFEKLLLLKANTKL